jgi:hypothetical protein
MDGGQKYDEIQRRPRGLAVFLVSLIAFSQKFPCLHSWHQNRNLYQAKKNSEIQNSLHLLTLMLSNLKTTFCLREANAANRRVIISSGTALNKVIEKSWNKKVKETIIFSLMQFRLPPTPLQLKTEPLPATKREKKTQTNVNDSKKLGLLW